MDGEGERERERERGGGGRYELDVRGVSPPSFPFFSVCSAKWLPPPGIQHVLESRAAITTFCQLYPYKLSNLKMNNQRNKVLRSMN